MSKFLKYAFFAVCARLLTTAFFVLIMAYISSSNVSGPGGKYYLEASDNQSNISTDQRIDLYDKAIQLQPNNSLYLYKRGSLYFYIGDFKNACPDLKRSSAMIDDLEKPRRLFLKGLCEGELQNYSEAESDFKLAISLLPGDGGIFGA